MSMTGSLDGTVSNGRHSRNSSTSSSGLPGTFAAQLSPQMLAPPPPAPHVGLVPPVVVPTPPMPPTMLHAGRFSPIDHVSPEITHSPNPLRQLLQQPPLPSPPPLPSTSSSMGMPQYPPPSVPSQQLMQHQNQLLQQFMSSSNNSNINGYMRGGPLPSASPLSAPSAPPASLFQQFPPPRSSPHSMSHQQQQQSSNSFGVQTLSSAFPVVRSVSSTIESSSRTTNGAGSSTGSHSGSPRRGNRPGTRLAGDTVEYRTRGEQPGDATNSRSLEVMPITLYNSERTSQLGALLSVNDHFISYPIRNGLIRVISQSSVDRLLIRKHEHHAVTELAFFSSSSNLLLSSGTDNEIAIWRIDHDPMNRELLATIRTPAQRVKWHPFDASKLAIVHGGTAFVTDLTSVRADGTGADNLYEISVVCSQTAAQIHDVAFSPSGGALLTAGADGLVHVYRISERANNHAGEFVHRFEPFDGLAVNSLHFFSNGNTDAASTQLGLVIGGDRNTRLSVWNAPLSESVQPVCVQTVKLLPSGSESEAATTTADAVVHETLLDPTTQFLFVADRTRPIVYVLHLALSAHGALRRFDNITEFALAYPVLSMGVLNRASQQLQPPRDGNDVDVADNALLNFSMQLYTLQTQAIQRYHVAATSCFVPLKPSAASSSTATAAAARASIEDEVPSNERSSDGFGQSVGALTTEGESVGGDTSHQSAAESPRATTSSPETELDAQENGVAEINDDDDDEDEEDEENEEDDDDDDDRDDSSAFRSPVIGSLGSPARSVGGGYRPAPASLATDDTTSSLGGIDDDTSGGPAFNLRASYVRSSPSSSVRACHDEASSVQYEPSLDGAASESSQQTLLAALRRMEASQSARDEQLREQMRTVMGSLGTHLTAHVAVQVEKSIQKQLQTVLVPAMGRIVLHTMENNFMKPVQNGFQHVIAEKLIPHMELKLSESLSAALPTQMTAGVHDIVDRVVEDVRQPVRESFRECFQDIIIPSFQAATQKMFEQINDTFVQGTRSAFENSGQSNSNAQVTKQLAQLIDVVGALSAKVDALTAHANGSGSSNDATVAAAAATPSPEVQQLEAQKSAVRAFLARNDYEEAFKLALGAQNVDLVAFTCAHCDVRAVLNVRPLQLSQMLILCLVQQLGADLVDDLQTKLSWLRESLLVMDVRDASIAGFVSSVLQELQVGLNNVPSAYRDAQFTLIYHILNSLLSSTA